MKKKSKMLPVLLAVLAAASLVFAGCQDLPEEESDGAAANVIAAASDAVVAAATTTTEVTQKWTFQDSATGLTEGSAISANVTYLNGMTLLGASRTFTWAPKMASPGGSATLGAMKVGGKTAAGVYFLQIANVQGPFKITLNYAGNGDSSRSAEIFVNGQSVLQGAASVGKALVSPAYSYTGTDKVTVQLGCSDAINLFDVNIVSTITTTTNDASGKWTFVDQDSAKKLVDYSANSTVMKEDVAYLNGMTLLGSQRDFRWLPKQASPGGSASAGAIQTGGATSSGKYFLQIADVQGPFKITLYYSNTSTTAGRYTEIFVNGKTALKGADSANTTTVTSAEYNYTGTDKVTVQLGCGGGAIRLHDVIIAGSSGGTTTTPSTVAVTGVTVSGGGSVEVGKTRTLTAAVAPDNATNKSVTWSSSDTSIATVSTSGVVTGVKAGSVTITAKTADGNKTATASVTVTAAAAATVAVTGVTVSGGGDVEVGKTRTLTATVAPTNATNKTVTWSSSATSIATVDSSGVVTGVKAGTATITAKTADGNKTATASVTVKAAAAATVAVTGVSVSGGGSVTAGSTKTLTVTVTPDNASNKTVTWSSSDTSIATVSSSGVVTAVKAGTATITAKAADSSGKSGTATITVTAASSGGSTGGATGTTSGSVTIKEAKGWLESLYVTWNKSGSSNYTVEYQKSGGSWVKLDDPLIREYSGSVMRADAVGLSSGTYSVRVATSGSTSYATASGISVKAHDRSGFAHWSSSTHKTGSGAYNDDGTLKSNAKVIYLTAKTAKTVKLSVAESASKTTECTGIGDILAKRQKGYDTTPLAIRIVGTIPIDSISDQLGSNTLLQVKGKAGSQLLNMTIEGIGNDATAYGWGILVRQAGNVEIRNIGFMMFPEDGVSLDTDNQNIWVHNNDFFYGKEGSGDKAKGDGALDSKKTGFATLSYNHFWDSGKANLLGNGTEDPEKLTYHHNWYDHSDSRHPRVRFHSAHVYNNYYDGVCKYGVGATCGSSIFAEANYFRQTKNPLAISLQGSDTQYGAKSDSDGAFSKEDGGMIKSYNNYFDSFSAGYYKPYSSSNTIQFDAYEAARGTSVPSSVKTKAGSKTYNNFDSSMYSYTAESASTAKSTVETYAGRMQGKSGADFSWNFTSADDTDHDRNSGLDSALKAYKTKVVAIQGQ